MVMNDVYKQYNVLPKLTKIEDRQVFIDEYPEVQNKAKSLLQQACVTGSLTKVQNDVVCDFIKRNHYKSLVGTNLGEIALQVDEDICIHDREKLIYIHACAPGGWNPGHIIGKTFNEVHKPTPQINLDHTDKLINLCIDGGPFERPVWGVIYDDQVNYHTDFVHPNFNADNPRFNVRVERQTIRGFPEHNIFLFAIKYYLICEKNVNKKVLFNSLSNMSAAHKVYKSVSQEFIDYLGRE